MKIKPIETVYNGYRFRSRLEARWAVFYDAVGIPYVYEPEGFEFDNGTRYLPDFYLPWFQCYVEIKPFGISEIDLKIATEKCCELFDSADVITTMLCVGDPVDWNVKVFCNDTTDGSGGGPNGWDAWFIPTPSWFEFKYPISLCASGLREDRSFYTSAWCWADIINADDCTDGYKYKNYYQIAKMKARKARFEYGETPNIRR